MPCVNDISLLDVRIIMSFKYLLILKNIFLVLLFPQEQASFNCGVAIGSITLLEVSDDMRCFGMLQMLYLLKIHRFFQDIFSLQECVSDKMFCLLEVF